MSRRRRIITSLVVVLLSFVMTFGQSASAAGVPLIFSYQGRLSDSSGNLLSGTYYLKFSIWDVATGGTAGTNRLWPSSDPTSSSATVTSGVFNVNIGDTANGYPDTLNYNFNTDQDIYLQVEVSSDNSTFQALTPRQRISSTPFAQVAGSVNGTGQSSFGTASPVSNAVVTVQATTTSSIPLLIRGALGQTANILSAQDSTGSHLFSIGSLGGIFGSSTLVVGSSTGNTSFTVNSDGNVGIGTGAPSRKLNVLGANSSPQVRVSQTGSVYGELYTDSAGDVQVSSTGGNIRMQDENLWACAGGSCGVSTPVDKGNVIVETSVIFNNSFRLKQVDASTTIMYDSEGNTILEFDEGQ